MTKYIDGIVRFFREPGEFKKGYVAALGAISLMISQGLVHGTAQTFWQTVISWMTFFGVVLFRNARSADPNTSTPDL